MAPVLVEVDCTVPLAVPVPLELVALALEEACDPAAPDVLATVIAAPVPVGAPKMVKELVVIAAGWNKTSVPVRVSVVCPGKLACAPPKDSMQTADVVPASEQSMVAVLFPEMVISTVLQ
jgi:hypothetical protein